MKCGKNLKPYVCMCESWLEIEHNDDLLHFFFFISYTYSLAVVVAVVVVVDIAIELPTIRIQQRYVDALPVWLQIRYLKPVLASSFLFTIISNYNKWQNVVRIIARKEKKRFSSLEQMLYLKHKRCTLIRDFLWFQNSRQKRSVRLYR